MTGQLAAQRTELMNAYGQIDERRRFTESVLSGVSAGVIGLDRHGAHRTAEPRRGRICWAPTFTPRSAISSATWCPNSATCWRV